MKEFQGRSGGSVGNVTRFEREFGYFVRDLLLPEIEIIKGLRWWRLEAAVLLVTGHVSCAAVLLGLKPFRGSILGGHLSVDDLLLFTQQRELYILARDAIREGELLGKEEVQSGKVVFLVKSREFLKWVKEDSGTHDLRIPEFVQDLADSPEEEYAELVPSGEAAPQASSDAEEPQEEYVFERDNDFWRIVFQGRKLPPVKHMDGMTYIACLLRTPGRSVSLLDLGIEAKGMALVPGAPAKAITDPALQKAYQRVRELNEEIEDAEECGHTDRKRKAQEEKDRILEELNKVTDRSGSVRTISPELEKLRKSVSRAIGRAWDEIATADPVFANHLRNSTKRGLSPTYNPNKGISWTVSCH